MMKENSPVYVYVYKHITLCLSIPIIGHLGCFHSLTFVSSAAVNTDVHISLNMLTVMPRGAIVGSTEAL